MPGEAPGSGGAALAVVEEPPLAPLSWEGGMQVRPRQYATRGRDSTVTPTFKGPDMYAGLLDTKPSKNAVNSEVLTQLIGGVGRVDAVVVVARNAASECNTLSHI